MARERLHGRLASACLALLLAPMADAQSVYQYRGPDGEWIYTDRAPGDGAEPTVRNLGPSAAARRVHVETRGDGAVVYAENPFHAPVELVLRLTRLEGFEAPAADSLAFVLPPQSGREVLTLRRLADGRVPALAYEYQYRFGDPGSTHRPPGPYRVPFAVATRYLVTQAYPQVLTHTTPDSRYVVDVAMPIGTDIFAARGGVVFDVSANNFRGGLDAERDGPAANVVQILHDDGTYALYGHLNWNSIRVKPGDRVAEGQYIADSGNTGYSSGPHLHFVVLKNDGRRTVSVPVTFRGAGNAGLPPATGAMLTAY